ncbi:caldesmon-like [Manduca sexta]|uniref:caldesmon-like n=1 Tax=Manduca sexta TaxID=7130 RepID=UPI00188F56BF|nr:caldesmon-like [Manduca sexta]
MLSTTDLERLIAVKRREIEKEKTHLGLSAPPDSDHQVNFENVVSEKEDATEDKKDCKNLYDLEEHIPPDLEKYIRRYLGLPVMLKAGEYSPNNPLIRAERNTGDVLLALGEYERRRNTLRRLRQQQYKDYLDQQAKKKQEAKEQAEKERREREEKERLREERERERLLLERERRSPVRRPSLNYNTHVSNKVDTGVQVNGLTKPLSVAVQTDDAELYRVCPWTAPCGMTQAERELSPRAAAEHEPTHNAHAHHTHVAHPRPAPRHAPRSEPVHKPRDEPKTEPRLEHNKTRSELPLTASLVKRSNQDKLLSELRHTHMPSIFDADAIQLRNLQAEKEAAERRQFYQQELKNQIMEQQRIKEERKSREKLLEQAEMRRLEEQLRMLRVAQDRERGKQLHLDTQITENAIEYKNKRIEMQKEIDSEQQKLNKVKTQPRKKSTTKSDSQSKLPPQYPRTDKKKPFSINISDNSLFSPNYDVDSYLRRNLNYNIKEDKNKNYLTESLDYKYPSIDDSIPVLRHSPVKNTENVQNNNLSEAMKKVEDKWKVPAVQKNILKSLPNDEGKNISILTQLGSIRRQLQLEQLKLDQMSPKEDA